MNDSSVPSFHWKGNDRPYGGNDRTTKFYRDTRTGIKLEQYWNISKK